MWFKKVETAEVTKETFATKYWLLSLKNWALLNNGAMDCN